jgi:hypothetical protein
MRTKEEILRQWDWDNYNEILSAMEEYAKEVALEFYEFEQGVPPQDMESNFEFFINQKHKP